MGEAFVKTDLAADPAGLPRGRLAKSFLDLRLAGAQHGELRAFCQQRGQRRQQQVMPLLPGQPADHPEERGFLGGRETEMRL